MTGANDNTVSDEEFAKWEAEKAARIAESRPKRSRRLKPADASEPAADPATEITALLGLPSVGLEVTAARVVGRGSRASADIYLSDGTALTFEAVRDIANPTRLIVEVASCTGATPSLKVAQAVRVVALVRALAEHHDTLTSDQLSVEWGLTFLQAADTVDVDLSDQQERWAAFERLDTDPVGLSRMNNVPVAQVSTVLRDQTGTRMVRCGWFREHARRDDPAVSPEQVAQRMLRVGWTRRGSHGRIKATRPGFTESLVWSFYDVPAHWEDVA